MHHTEFAILGMILLGTGVQGCPPAKAFDTVLGLCYTQKDITRDGGAGGVLLQKIKFSTLEVFYSDCYTRTVGLHYSDNLGWDYALYVLFILFLVP